MADDKDAGKVTLDVKDLIGAVAKGLSGAGNSPISNMTHSADKEQKTKDWINSTVDSISVVAATLETVRTIEIPAVKRELRDELAKIERRLDKNDLTRVNKEDLSALKEVIGKLDIRLDKFSTALEDLKTKVVKPLSDSLIAISVKIGIYGLLAGFIGSGVMAFIVYMLQLGLHHAAGTAPPSP